MKMPTRIIVRKHLRKTPLRKTNVKKRITILKQYSLVKIVGTECDGLKGQVSDIVTSPFKAGDTSYIVRMTNGRERAFLRKRLRPI